jgi:hypothetical protein
MLDWPMRLASAVLAFVILAAVYWLLRIWL